MSELKELRILPPLAIARFGSSPKPMENYTVQLPEDGVVGFRKLNPSETLIVNRDTGEITGTVTPEGKVSFRDENGLIKPVSPFFEVWARFDENDFLEPLTVGHFGALQSAPEQVRWRVRVGNHKMFRRTGQSDDKIEADTGLFGDHIIHDLTGRANNFKTEKTVKLGSVQYIKPTDAFPEIRLRFTPAQGKVYGHRNNDANTADDVYDATLGLWDNHNDGDASLPTNTPLSTIPVRIYARDQINARNLGYLDDSCDGFIEFELTVNNQTFSALARITVGPPDFAPDSFHLRTVADEIEQILFGLSITETVSVEQASDLVRRALETMRLMNSEYWNTAYRRSSIPLIFEPEIAKYASVRGRHEKVLQFLQNLDSADEDERSEALGMLVNIRSILRKYEQTANRTREIAQLMPAMMRGSDGLDVAVTRRQLNILEKAAQDFSREPEPSVPAPNPAEEDFLRIIAEFSFHASRHTNFTVDAGGTLSDLFSDPPAVLEYLKTAKARGMFAGSLAGQPLVVPGNADGSAFIALVQKIGHPMRNVFMQVDSTTQKRRIDIVREWINLLPSV